MGSTSPVESTCTGAAVTAGAAAAEEAAGSDLRQEMAARQTAAAAVQTKAMGVGHAYLEAQKLVFSAMNSGPVALDVLVVDDEINLRKTLVRCLELDGYRVIAVGNGKDALEAAARQPFDLAFLDLRLGTTQGIDFIEPLRAASPGIQIVMITAYATVETAVAAMKKGAVDYLPKPFTPDQVLALAARAAERRRNTAALAAAPARAGEAEWESRSPALHRALALARQVAPTETCVLLRGESGTGKGELARTLHAWSGRAAKPFAEVSCPSLSPALLESELFGHVRGAFTGAFKDAPGRVAQCEGGTLFLDEVGDLPAAVQPKLLRFLQEHAYERVGESVTRRADVRVVAATNRDLEKAVAEGAFREDLWYRLNVFPIELPALRDRPDDVLPLARRFLARFTRQNSRVALQLSPEAERALHDYGWPGNVRELRNVMERASIVAQGPDVGLADLPAALAASRAAPTSDHLSLDAVEENHIRRVLAAAKTLEEAARILGVDLSTLWRRRKKYGI